MSITEAKSRQLNSKQKDVLVNFVHARPNMYKGKLTNTYINAISMMLWKEITTILNAIPGGAVKDWKQWRKAWTDIKKNVKSKISKEKKHSHGTVGEPHYLPLKILWRRVYTYDKIYEIITPVAINGNLAVPEPEIQFENPEIQLNAVLRETSDINEELERNESIEIIHIHQDDEMEDQTQQIITKLCKRDDNTEASQIDKNVLTPKGAGKGNAPIKVKKRYTKTSRLTDSIRNNRKFLEISETNLTSTNTYRENKLELLRNYYENQNKYYNRKIEDFENKAKYREQKLRILNDIANAVTKIPSPQLWG